MGLLEWQHRQRVEATAPLAARMRPRTLDDFVGQGHIVGPGRLLRRAIEADRLSSLLFYGPPGTGKTTLARIIAGSTSAYFIAINAVLAGVKNIREAIAEAKERRLSHDQRTILFVDEVHRFNKSQQDALLPWVEEGTVILIGATTENPYFEVNKALVSRSRVFQLSSLDAPALRRIVWQVLADVDRGYGGRRIEIADDALEHLVSVANGDARALLNALELAVETTPVIEDELGQKIAIGLSVAEESIQQRAVLYDKEGDAHFDTISAFIKSVRGSDPDASLFWLAKMVYAGEDPRFILRRLLILASEDIGLADPQALAVITSCAAAFDRVGMPEGRFHLAQATLYLATAPKSNSTMGFFDALKAVEDEQAQEVPNAIRDPSRDKKGFGHGEGYLYPHSYRDHWVEQQYLPASLQGRSFYQPSDQGYEGRVKTQVDRRREAQLAASVEGVGQSPAERLTWAPEDRVSQRWLARAIGRVGDQLAVVRDQIFDASDVPRHGVVLVLAGASGLLAWEAVRRAPEGGVWVWARNADEAAALRDMAGRLPDLRRPSVLSGTESEIRAALPEALLFDAIIGRVYDHESELQTSLAAVVAARLAPSGRAVFAQSLVGRTERLAAQLPHDDGDTLLHRWAHAEDSLYAALENDAHYLAAPLEAAGVPFESREFVAEHALLVAPHVVQRWFQTLSSPGASYGERLGQRLADSSDVDAIKRRVVRHLQGTTLPWRTTFTLLLAKPSPTETSP